MIGPAPVASWGAVGTGPVFPAQRDCCAWVCRALTGGVGKAAEAGGELVEKPFSEHFDLVAAIGVEQAVAGGSLGLFGFQRRVGAMR